MYNSIIFISVPFRLPLVVSFNHEGAWWVFDWFVYVCITETLHLHASSTLFSFSFFLFTVHPYRVRKLLDIQTKMVQTLIITIDLNHLISFITNENVENVSLNWIHLSDCVSISFITLDFLSFWLLGQTAFPHTTSSSLQSVSAWFSDSLCSIET